MPISFASPIAVLTVVLLALVGLSYAEPELDRLCEQQVVRNGFPQSVATARCARL